MDQVVKTQVKRLVHIWNYILCLAQYQTQIWHKYPSLCSFVTFYYFFWRDVLKSQALEKVQASVMWAYFIWVFLWFYIIIMWAFACWKLHFHIAENLMIACPWAWNFRRSLIIPSQHLEYYGCICKQLIVHTVADICVYYCLFCSEITLFPSHSFRLQAQLVCYTAKTRDTVIFIRVGHCNNLCTVVVCILLLLGGVFLLLLLSFWFIPLLKKMSYKKNKFVSQIQNNVSYFS